MSTEETVFRSLPLPDGMEFAVHADANVVVLSDKLDCAGKLRVLEEIQKQWRRAHLKIAETA